MPTNELLVVEKLGLIKHRYTILENRLKISVSEYFTKNEIEIPLDEISISSTESLDYSRGATLWLGVFNISALIFLLLPFDQEAEKIGLFIFCVTLGFPGVILFYFKYRRWIVFKNKDWSVYFPKKVGTSNDFFSTLHTHQLILIKRRLSKICHNYERVSNILSWYEDNNVLTFAESESMMSYAKHQYEILKIEQEMNNNSSNE